MKNEVSIINVKQHEVRVLRIIVVVNWMSSRTSFNFYSLWEELNNPEFNFMELHKIKLSTKRFMMTPKQWKDKIIESILETGEDELSNAFFTRLNQIFAL